jgi:hypothetical protein
MDLQVHVKDDNLMKATYMGGGKLDLSEFFQPRDDASGWKWIPSHGIGSEKNMVERVVSLTFADEKFAKKRASGEITLRFHFATEPLILEPAPPPPSAAAPSMDMNTTTLSVEGSTTPTATVEQPENDGISQVEPLSPPSTSAKPNLTEDIKMLSIELLCGRDLVKPSAGNLAKSMLKSLFDRRPDPYAELVLGTESKKCQGVNDVDVSFFEWTHAIQVFELRSKPYPETLLIHIRDQDMAGTDPYMGGARVNMQEIWEEAVVRSRSNPPGDPQLSKTYELAFMDENMTKQKARGSVTVRFRWIFSDVELSMVPHSVRILESASATTEEKERTPMPKLQPLMGYVFLRNLTLYNNVELLDASLDLYVEASALVPGSEGSTNKEVMVNHHGPPAISSVLTDAMKGKDDLPNAKVDWAEDELVVPLCIPSHIREDASALDLQLCLKDKNAILKDTDIASKRLRLREHAVDFVNGQPVTITVQLDTATSISKKAKSVSTLKFELELQFLAHNSPLLSATTSPTSASGIVTIFLIQSVFSPPPTTARNATDTVLGNALVSLEMECLTTKKPKSLLSFGASSPPDFQSPYRTVSEGYEGGKALIWWWTTSSIAISNKQLTALKEKEAFEVEFTVKAGKKENQGKTVGSLQANLYSMLFTEKASTRIETIEFGSLGTMQLEFAVGFRALNTLNNASIGKGGGTTKHVAPHVPSGDLHLLVLCARNLVSPDPENESAEELDPEVRISVEPKYITRKDHPVRSKLKTRPLENAGATPTWNEYVRLEYRLPPSPPMPPAERAVRTVVASEDRIKYPPPIVQLGVFDIQLVRGWKNSDKSSFPPPI